MMAFKSVSLSGALPLCFVALLLSAGRTVASEPNSTPAEKSQTQQLNQSITHANAVSDAETAEKSAVYQAQVDRYQEQLKVYRAGQENYEERAAAYLAARDRYVSAHARYHRASWPADADKRLIVDTNDLLGADVHTWNGHTVGHVVEIALISGKVSALRVSLDSRKGDVWIESPDLRFNADKKFVMTNLSRRDLNAMSRDTY